MITAIGNNRYRYDGAGRLDEATTYLPQRGISEKQVYTYDDFDNMTKKRTEVGGTTRIDDYGVDARNQISEAGFDYDVTGNLETDGCLRFDYDALDMIVRITPGGSGGTECNVHHTHLYDANNLRVLTMKDVPGSSPRPSFTFTASPLNRFARGREHLDVECGEPRDELHGVPVVGAARKRSPVAAKR